MPKKDTRKDKVGIVANYATGDYAPWEDKSFDFWILNGDIKYHADKPNVTKWFDLHDWGRANYVPYYLEDVPDKPSFEVVTLHRELDCPYTVFPYNEIVEKYGPFFENSIPMMAAYAGLLDYKYIYLFGLGGSELLDGEAKMTASLYHTIGMLRQEGRKVYFVNYATMETMGLYGFKDLRKTRLPDGFRFTGYY